MLYDITKVVRKGENVPPLPGPPYYDIIQITMRGGGAGAELIPRAPLSLFPPSSFSHQNPSRCPRINSLTLLSIIALIKVKD